MLRPVAETRMPDFIIGGAPKSGTTSLHFILDQHPEIGIPENEVHYFDADDPVTHSDFMWTENGKMVWYDPDSVASKAYYARRFAPFSDKRHVGEDSTTYIFSSVAASRIADRLPDAKLIFMLRHPVKRAYSQYWHMINSARTSLTFEQALRRFSNIVLGSTYTPHLKPFFDLFPADQIKIVIFEDFITDQQAYLNEITDFIGAERQKINPDQAWFNKTLYGRNLHLQRALNLIGRRIVSGRYRTHMTDAPTHSVSEKVNNKLHHWFFNRLYPLILTQDKQPDMAPSTKVYLEQYLTASNRGLSDMLGRDVGALWGLDV